MNRVWVEELFVPILSPIRSAIDYEQVLHDDDDDR